MLATADEVSISSAPASLSDDLATARSERKEMQVKPKSRKKHPGRKKTPSQVSKARLARAIAMVRGNTIYGLRPPNAKKVGGKNNSGMRTNFSEPLPTAFTQAGLASGDAQLRRNISMNSRTKRSSFIRSRIEKIKRGMSPKRLRKRKAPVPSSTGTLLAKQLPWYPYCVLVN